MQFETFVHRNDVYNYAYHVEEIKCKIHNYSQCNEAIQIAKEHV